MNILKAELLKLHRSAIWVIVAVIPTLSVITGTVNYMMNVGVLTPSWDDYWGQVTLFYGLIFLSIGIAILCSAVWRMEHRGNWPRLMASKVASWQLVGAKMLAVLALVAVMQLVLLLGAWIGGVFFGKLPPVIPGHIVGGTIVTAVAALAVISLQSLLSMVIRSFAAPVALALLGCVASIGLMLSGSRVLSLLLPYGHLSKAAQIGNGALADAPTTLTLPVVFDAVWPSLALALLFAAAATAHLEKKDI